MTVFKNQLTKFLKIELLGQYNLALAHHWHSRDLQVGLNKSAMCLVLPSRRCLLVLQSG